MALALQHPLCLRCHDGPATQYFPRSCTARCYWWWAKWIMSRPTIYATFPRMPPLSPRKGAPTPPSTILSHTVSNRHPIDRSVVKNILSYSVDFSRALCDSDVRIGRWLRNKGEQPDSRDTSSCVALERCLENGEQQTRLPQIGVNHWAQIRQNTCIITSHTAKYTQRWKRHTYTMCMLCYHQHKLHK